MIAKAICSKSYWLELAEKMVKRTNDGSDIYYWLKSTIAFNLEQRHKELIHVPILPEHLVNPSKFDNRWSVKHNLSETDKHNKDKWQQAEQALFYKGFEKRNASTYQCGDFAIGFKKREEVILVVGMLSIKDPDFWSKHLNIYSDECEIIATLNNPTHFNIACRIAEYNEGIVKPEGYNLWDSEKQELKGGYVSVPLWEQSKVYDSKIIELHFSDSAESYILNGK